MKPRRIKTPSIKTCPICHTRYRGYPALSRTDDKTPICPNCGTKQAIAAFLQAKVGGGGR
jgi:RNA polymerase subunit RPABC4/transcription elongation factor Spt4